MIRRFDPARALVPNGDTFPAFLQPLLRAARAGEDLHPPVEGAVKHLGFTSMMYGGNTVPSSVPTDRAGIYVFTTHDTAWINRYAKMHYLAVDPRVTRTWDTTLPLLWDQASERGRGEEEDRFLDEAAAHGIGSGIALAFQTGPGLRVVASLAQPDLTITPERRAQIVERVGDIYLFITTFHALFTQAIVECLYSPPQVGAPVSEMEAMALGLLAKGQSVTAIADAFALDPADVERYLRNACTKLGAAAPDIAVRRALEQGLLRAGGPAVGLRS